MSIRQSTFPDQVWDGLAPTLASRLQDKSADYSISDQHAAEIIALEEYIKAYVDLLRLIGNPDTVLGVTHDGTGLEYKRILSGANVTVTHGAGSITISSTGGGGGSGDLTYSGETDSDITVGQPVYVLSNTHIDLAKADNAATMQVAGLVSVDALATTGGSYVSDGQIVLPDWTAITGATDLISGSLYFLDNSTAGMLTATAPTSGFIISVGRAMNTTTLDIEISESVKL
jgi:uncharacterized membrane protein YgdD (TMEM256/DUF423 family)